MKDEYYKAMVYLFEKILPTITDERIDIYSRRGRCIHCCNFDGKEELETSFLEIYIEKQKDRIDEIWVLKILRNCTRCNSYENETVELKYITRAADYIIGCPMSFKREHVLKGKCNNCGSNLWCTASGNSCSGGSHVVCKKCGFTGKRMNWD